MTPSRTPPVQSMSLARLRTILEAYGATPGRWPAEERAAAESLVASSAEARALLAEAQARDGALDGALAAWQPEVPDAALARLTAATAFPPPREAARTARSARRAGGGIGGWLQAAFWPRAAGFAAIAMLGIVVGLSVDPAYSSSSVIADDDTIATIDGDVILLDLFISPTGDIPPESQTKGP